MLEGSLDTEVKTQVVGVRVQMESFTYFFGISVAELVLKHGDNLSVALQSSTISAGEGQRIAALTVKTLVELRTDQSFSLFCNLVLK